MAEPFRVRLTVRSYEIDARGHLSAIACYQYAEHAPRPRRSSMRSGS